eukprot:3191259-Alexandrium_andersonii.AAC.1
MRMRTGPSAARSSSARSSQPRPARTSASCWHGRSRAARVGVLRGRLGHAQRLIRACLLYTSDAADDM